MKNRDKRNAKQAMPKPPMMLCERCGRMLDWAHCEGWNGCYSAGRLYAVVCPACQTDEESIEAEANAAVTDYEVQADGTVKGYMKGARHE